MEREIAKVERVDLGFEDHMIFGWNIGFKGGGWGQGTGWCSLQGGTEEVSCGLLKRIVEGHAYDERNTHVRPNGRRQCRPCQASRSRERYARLRGRP